MQPCLKYWYSLEWIGIIELKYIKPNFGWHAFLTEAIIQNSCIGLSCLISQQHIQHKFNFLMFSRIYSGLHWKSLCSNSLHGPSSNTGGASFPHLDLFLSCGHTQDWGWTWAGTCNARWFICDQVSPVSQELSFSWPPCLLCPQ